MLVVGNTIEGIDATSERDGFIMELNTVTKEILWSRAYDIGLLDDLTSVIVASDGSIVAAGSSGNATNTQSMWFLRVDRSLGQEGNVLASTLFNQGNRNAVTSIIESATQVDGAASFLVTGPTSNFDDIYAARIAIDGTVDWSRQYGTLESWTYTVLEAPDRTIYLSGTDNMEERLFILHLNTNGTIRRSTTYAHGLGGFTANCVIRDMLLVGNQLVTVGSINNGGYIQSFFLRIDTNELKVVDSIRYYNNSTLTTQHSITDIEPIFDGTIVVGYLTHMRHNIAADARFLRLDAVGNVVGYISLPIDHQLGTISIATDNRHFFHVGTVNEQVYINRLPLNFEEYGCTEELSLSVVDSFTSDTSFAVTTGTGGDSILSVTIDNTLEWRNYDRPCCAMVNNDTSYIRVDRNQVDPRLADYGISPLGANSFTINNNAYNRLPPRLYIGEGTTLFITTTIGQTTTADFTNCDVVLEQNAKIEVERGSHLIANNAVFRPCDPNSTWDGIVVAGRAAGSLSNAITSTEATFKDCTFINASKAVVYRNAAIGDLSDNLFYNCQEAVLLIGTLLDMSLSSNVFKIDNNALDLIYTASTPQNHELRYELEFVGIRVFGTSSTATISHPYIISQNQFINATRLNVINPQYNGIVLFNANDIDIANNNFTNNDVSVVVHYSRRISIENNFMEVTRRSTVDENFYQIVALGPTNSTTLGGSIVLIKGNTIVNSADVQTLTTAPLITGNYGNTNNPPPTVTLVQGTGAIYNIGNNGGAVKIIDNDISGFEVGIYTEKSSTLLITKNRIHANVYGIYALEIDGLLGCNEITMDLDANVISEGGVVGIRLTHEAGTVSNPTFVFGNCIKNTDRAIFLGTVPGNTNTYYTIGQTRVQNNYLFNYTEAGLFTNNYTSNGNQARFIRRNAFISNQPTGTGDITTGAFDVVTANSGVANNIFVLDDNYYGTDNMANHLAYNTDPSSTNLIEITLGGMSARPFTACGGMDVGSITTLTDEEEDWMYRCNDENFIGATIAQRTATGISLVATYHDILTTMGKEDVEQAANTAIQYVELLGDINEVEQLYQSAQQLSLTTVQRQWLQVAYYQRLQNWSAAEQILNQITATVDNAAKLTIVKARIAIAQQSNLNDATLLADLKVLAEQYGNYRHEARELLNNYTAATYTFSYNPVNVYQKAAKTTSPLQQTTNSNFRVLPNPATDNVRVQFTDNANNWTTAELYDLHGRLIKSQTVNAYTLQFDVSELAPSVYFITLKADNGEQVTEKFVKQ